MKKAVCALVANVQGKILARSRLDDETKFGLPGGKVEEGETLEQAVVREVKEETGLDFFPTMAVYTRPCRGETDYETTTFIGIASGVLHSEEAGVTRWVDEQVLLDGPFGPYNKELFDAVEKAFGKR